MAAGSAGSEGKPADESGTVWDRPVRRAHAQQPSLSRDQIVLAAIEAADEEGAEAISMRRVAARLGSGTMTLYWYISNKQDLVDLMSTTFWVRSSCPPCPWVTGA